MTEPHPHALPGTLDRAGLRRVVNVLSVTVITGYGVLYYAFPVLLTSIVDDTGWSPPAVVAAFSASQIVAGVAGIRVGPILDDHGPRVVMTAGSVLALPAIILIAFAPNYGTFFAGWMVAGLAMAGLLYPPAFAALTHWGGERRVAALTTLTLVAGLASTVFAPLTAVLNNQVGWRATYVVLAAILVVITVPAHWFGLAQPWVRHETTTDVARSRGGTGSVTRSRAFLLLAISFSAAAFTVYASVINLVPLLIERGLTPGIAALALGLGGIGQVAGRLGYAGLAARTTTPTRTVIVIGFVALSTALVATVPGPVPVLIAMAILLGAARGVFTLVQATAVSDRWGVRGFGRLNGLVAAPVLLTAAIAPFAGSALAELIGGQTRAFLVLGLVAAVAALIALGSIPDAAESDSVSLRSPNS